MHEDGAVAAALDVVLARPDQLDRTFVLGGLQDLGGFRGHVAGRRRAPAEAAAGEQGLDLHLLRLEAENAGGHVLVDGLQLRAEQQLDAAVVGAVDHAVVGLHRGVREIGKRVGRLDHLGGAGSAARRVAVVARDRARRLGESAVRVDEIAAAARLGAGSRPRRS